MCKAKNETDIKRIEIGYELKLSISETKLLTRRFSPNGKINKNVYGKHKALRWEHGCAFLRLMHCCSLFVNRPYHNGVKFKEKKNRLVIMTLKNMIKTDL